MNKTKIIGAIGIGVIAVLLLIWVIVAINVSKIEPIVEVTEVAEVVEQIIIQDNMLQKLIDEPGIDMWSVFSYDNDERYYVDIEFKSINGTSVELSRRFDSPSKLNENIELILEEARKLK